jgi:hypothetical protein
MCPGQEALGLAGGRPLPGGVEVARAANALVVKTAKPLAWERIELAVTQSAATPLRRREVAVEGTAFDERDAGSFRHAGLDWTTSAELWVRDEAIGARLALGDYLNIDMNDLDPTLHDHYFVDLLGERMLAADFGRT